MIALLAVVLGQTPAKPVDDPRLHRTWVTVATPYPELKQWLRFEPGNRFTMTSKGPYDTDNVKAQGTYRLVKAEASMRTLFPKSSSRLLYVTPDVLLKTGADPATVARMKKAKQTQVLMMRLVYDPATTQLTDMISTVFAPVGMEAEVAKMYPRRPAKSGG
ncbi:hypothetical protein BH11ARM2_BH11ARM2_19200 [soil metagenome]